MAGNGVEGQSEGSEIELYKLSLEEKLVCSPTETLRKLARGLDIEESVCKDIKGKIIKNF